jgi:hypothetical protein
LEDGSVANEISIALPFRHVSEDRCSRSDPLQE